jgi:hypothetical protein
MKARQSLLPQQWWSWWWKAAGLAAELAEKPGLSA